MNPPPAGLAWGIWTLGALLCLVAFLQRVAPAVMTDQLVTEFAIGGAARLYDAAAFQAGFALMFATAVAVFGILQFVRETHCNQLE